MGTDKALFEVAGRPMLSYVAAAALEVTDQVVTVGRRERLLELTAVPDPQTAIGGPLSGLVGALNFGATDQVLLLAVDQPWVRPHTLHELVAARGPDPVVPFDRDVRQVTCAVYPARLLDAAHAELDSAGSIQSLLDRTNLRTVLRGEWAAWDEDGRSWYSVDSPERAEAGLAKFGPPGT